MLGTLHPMELTETDLLCDRHWALFIGRDRDGVFRLLVHSLRDTVNELLGHLPAELRCEWEPTRDSLGPYLPVCCTLGQTNMGRLAQWVSYHRWEMN